MKKICFLTSTLDYGGATKIMIELANYLADYFDVTIVNYGLDKKFYSIERKIKVLTAPHTKCKIPKIRLIAQMCLIRNYFRKAEYDLIVAFGNTEKLMALSATFGRKGKVVISERQDPYNYKPGKRHTMWLRYLLSDGCVFQTKGAMDYFPECVKKKSIVLPNFIQIDDKQFAPMEEKNKEIAFSARFEVKQKRQDIMVKSMKIVAEKHPDWKLVFYGDGDDQGLIEQMVEDFKLSENVVFAGKIKDVNEYIYKSAMLVLSSDYEGIPNVLIEAMAMGLPVISTDCSPGGARLLIKNDENGILVPVGNSQKLAKAINKLIENPYIANQYAVKATRVKNKFTPEKILPLWKRYFERVLGI